MNNYHINSIVLNNPIKKDIREMEKEKIFTFKNYFFLSQIKIIVIKIK